MLQERHYNSLRNRIFISRWFLFYSRSLPFYDVMLFFTTYFFLVTILLITIIPKNKIHVRQILFRKSYILYNFYSQVH